MKSFKRDTNEYIIMALNTKNDIGILNYNKVPVYKELIGMYKGIKESSYLVPYCENAIILASIFNQESILILNTMENSSRIASLGHIDPVSFRILRTKIGIFKNIGPKKPKENAWTYDIACNSYYIIEDLGEYHD
jgi:hypothetical protein